MKLYQSFGSFQAGIEVRSNIELFTFFVIKSDQQICCIKIVKHSKDGFGLKQFSQNLKMLRPA